MTHESDQSDEITTNSGSNLPGWIKMALDFGPLIVFFVAFKLGDLFVATGVFMAASIAAMVISKLVLGKVAAMLKFTVVVVVVMGGLTLYLQDETFVKMKLTIINSVMAIILLYGLLRGKLYLKMVMEMAIDMDDAGWKTFSRNWIIYMLVMAGVNEIVWRTQTTEFWVNFKTFGYIGATMVFMIGHAPLFMRYIPEDENH
jgi:intracellular septation protein